MNTGEAPAREAELHVIGASDEAQLQLQTVGVGLVEPGEVVTGTASVSIAGDGGRRVIGVLPSHGTMDDGAVLELEADSAYGGRWMLYSALMYVGCVVAGAGIWLLRKRGRD